MNSDNGGFELEVEICVMNFLVQISGKVDVLVVIITTCNLYVLWEVEFGNYLSMSSQAT